MNSFSVNSLWISKIIAPNESLHLLLQVMLFYMCFTGLLVGEKNQGNIISLFSNAGLAQYQPLYMLSTSSFDWWQTKTDYWLCPGAKNWNIFHILCSLERVEISYPLPNHWVVVWLYGTGSLSIFAWLPQIWYGLKAKQVGFYMYYPCPAERF